MSYHAESIAFLPQIVLSAIIIPIVMAKKDLYSTFLAQTFAFVTFNKVCTSQVDRWKMGLAKILVFSVVHGVPTILPSTILLGFKSH
jgi:phosphatidylinositol glycan class M